jgi:hypothetical protein
LKYSDLDVEPTKKQSEATAEPQAFKTAEGFKPDPNTLHAFEEAHPLGEEAAETSRQHYFRQMMQGKQSPEPFVPAPPRKAPWRPGDAVVEPSEIHEEFQPLVPRA